MNRYFTDTADEDYKEWLKTNKRVFKKINDLLEDIEDNGFGKGLGKPERLKHFEEPTFSRRIDKLNRLVYRPYGDNDILILSCKGHYQDK